MENIDWIKTADQFSPHPTTSTPLDPQSLPERVLRAHTVMQPQTKQAPEEEEKLIVDESEKKLKYSEYVEVGLEDIKLEERKEEPIQDIDLAHSEILEEDFKEAEESGTILDLKFQLSQI